MGGSNEKIDPLKEKEEEEKALTEEFEKLKNCPDLPINKCEYVDNNKKHWKIVFEGSKYSPYEGGQFTLELLFNKGIFPKYGPEAKFITNMFHPNIDSNGRVCINLLNEWKSTISIISVIFGILDILDHPVASGGYSNPARKLLEKDEIGFFKKVKEYTLLYAMQ